jgi:hypothetical protein
MGKDLLDLLSYCALTKTNRTLGILPENPDPQVKIEHNSLAARTKHHMIAKSASETNREKKPANHLPLHRSRWSSSRHRRCVSVFPFQKLLTKTDSKMNRRTSRLRTNL